MDEWTEPYEDEFLKERIDLLNQEQAAAADQGRLLVSSYEQFWLPVLNDLPEVEYAGRERFRAPYGEFAPSPNVPFHGALWFTPAPGADLPPALRHAQPWSPAGALVDRNSRTATIQAAGIEITFTAINISLSAHDLLQEINLELVRAQAGVYVWRIEPLDNPAAPSVQHLFPEGRIPVLSNAHTRADVTGFAVLEDRPHQHTLVYVGLAAHKTSVESLWASLIRGRGSCSMRGTSVLADGEVKMLTQPLPEFNVLHAGILCRKALPGKWETRDDAAYALVFGSDDTEKELSLLALRRLQEALVFPLPDEWSSVLWEYGLDTGYIQRLATGGDCRGGVRLDLTKDWQALVQSLLDQQLLTL